MLSKFRRKGKGHATSRCRCYSKRRGQARQGEGDLERYPEPRITGVWYQGHPHEEKIVDLCRSSMLLRTIAVEQSEAT
jgi:hypothetical protein